MGKEITVTWDSNMGADYAASVEALMQYKTLPSIAAQIGLKGQIPRECIIGIVKLAEQYEVPIKVKLKASWLADEEPQLRLWAPPQQEEVEAPKVRRLPLRASTELNRARDVLPPDVTEVEVETAGRTVVLTREGK